MIEYREFEGTVYVAGPLFSLAERNYIEQLVHELGTRMPGAEFSVPHRYAAGIAGQPDFLDRVFAWCLAAARKAEALVALLDGPDADSGTCIEMGTVYRKVPIFGVRTDFRALEDQGVNAMVSKVCTEMILLTETSVTVAEVADRIVAAFRRHGVTRRPPA